MNTESPEVLAANMDPEWHQKCREMVKNGTLLDDPIMNRLFSKTNVMERILQIALQDSTLKVQRLEIQKHLENIEGKSSRLDVFVVTNDLRQVDVEVQKRLQEYIPERLRYYHGIMDVMSLRAGQDYKFLPTQIVIFFCGFDPCNAGLPVYHVVDWILELNKQYDSRQEAILFNTTCHDGDTDIHRLNWDIQCPDPDQMRIDVLAEEMRKLKSTEKEVLSMCKEFGDAYLEGEAKGEAKGEAIGKAKGKQETARKLLSMGVLSFEQIAEATELSVSRIELLAQELNQKQ